ncbi:MAG TPA: hypothetical protein PKL78_00825 [Anaerolineales bacterium]|nr:hypothetical protein [Anaerolineales bacterium]
MKRAVGISLGSSKRDKKVVVNLNGQDIQVERIGMDGNVEKARQLYLELDGKVDAFGVGGVDLYLRLDQKETRFTPRSSLSPTSNRLHSVTGADSNTPLSGACFNWQRSNLETFASNRLLSLSQWTEWGWPKRLPKFQTRSFPAT